MSTHDHIRALNTVRCLLSIATNTPASKLTITGIADMSDYSEYSRYHKGWVVKGATVYFNNGEEEVYIANA